MKLDQEVGAADHDLDWHIKEVQGAAQDWGVQADAMEGRFVSALLAAIAASGQMNKATIEQVHRVVADAKAAGDIEVGRLKILFAGGNKAIELGRQAAETAVAAGQRAEQEFERSVAQIAKELSSRLVESSQQWLVLRQTSRNRRDAWILAVIVSIMAVGVFVGGYVARAYQDDVALSGFYEMQARIADCQRDPVRVKDAHVGGIRPACWLDQVLAKRGGG